jgi:ketosteroid isomerase-like protein
MTHTATPTDDIEALNREWMRSYVKRDTTFLRQYLADDYVGTFPDGTVLDKRGEIAALESGAVVITDMKASEMKVHLYGEAAVITGRSSIEAVVNGAAESGEYRFTDVWIKRGARWQAVASQVTRIARN